MAEPIDEKSYVAPLVNMNDNKVTYCNIRSFSVVQESEDYYIVKDKDGEIGVIDKDRCRVLVIEANALIR